MSSEVTLEVNITFKDTIIGRRDILEWLYLSNNKNNVDNNVLDSRLPKEIKDYSKVHYLNSELYGYNSFYLFNYGFDNKYFLRLALTNKNKDNDLEAFIKMLLPYIDYDKSTGFLFYDETDSLYEIDFKESLLKDT